jgi:hypothetical protein
VAEACDCLVILGAGMAEEPAAYATASTPPATTIVHAQVQP